MADGDQEFGAGEDQDLAEFNLLLFVDVAGRLQHDEQGVVVDLQLGPLMRLDGILDSQLVQLERAADGLELILGWLVEANPDESAGPCPTPGAACLLGVISPLTRQPAS